MVHVIECDISGPECDYIQDQHHKNQKSIQNDGSTSLSYNYTEVFRFLSNSKRQRYNKFTTLWLKKQNKNWSMQL